MVWPDPFAYCVQKVGPRWFGPTRLPIVSRRSGQDSSARPVCLLGPEGRAKMVWPTRLPIGSRRSGQDGLDRPVCLLCPEGRAKMVWLDRFAYWVQTPERRADISRPDPTRRAGRPDSKSALPPKVPDLSYFALFSHVFCHFFVCTLQYVL